MRSGSLARLLATGVCLLSLPAAISSRTSRAALDPDALTRQLTRAVARGDTPGVVAAVVDRQGVLYEGAAGLMDGETQAPMGVDAIFAIMSMTKPVTSVAIMMLAEQGTLRLDDPVSRYLDTFSSPRVVTAFDEADGSYQTRPAGRPMTIRHLLTHTSGIGYAFSSPVIVRMQKSTPKGELELPLLHDPGERWTYGASTRALGLIVERVTGSNLESWYQANIFKPLGMVDTSWAVPVEKQHRVPRLHARVNSAVAPAARTPIPSSPASVTRGDGGLYSTVHDYGRFMRMILNGGRLGSTKILSERSVRTMGENHIGRTVVEEQLVGDPVRTRPFPLGAGRDKFGLGFQIASGSHDPHGNSGNRFRSPGSLSWAGLYNTEFWIDPVKQIAGVQLMQLLPFYDEGAIRTLRDFEGLVYETLQ